jgi:aryl-alcohol dehydrogenase-like predicted oxidoreductase
VSGNGRELGGSFALGRWRVHRAGYGAMQLAGDGVFGPPRDRDEALRVLRAAVAAGVDHIDTAQYYGAGTVNQLIREALHPYPDGVAIVSKVAPAATRVARCCGSTSRTSCARASRTTSPRSAPGAWPP